jgi:hypothetical protein
MLHSGNLNFILVALFIASLFLSLPHTCARAHTHTTHTHTHTHTHMRARAPESVPFKSRPSVSCVLCQVCLVGWWTWLVLSHVVIWVWCTLPYSSIRTLTNIPLLTFWIQFVNNKTSNTIILQQHKKNYKHSQRVLPLTWQTPTQYSNCCQMLLKTLIFTGRVVLETESCTLLVGKVMWPHRP